MFDLNGKYGSYEGQMKFNEPEGKGTFTFDNGVIYDGQFQSGDFVHGKAIYPSEFVYAAGDKPAPHKGNFVYEGDFRDDDLFWKKGTLTFPDGTVLEAEFEDDMEITGTCRFILADGKNYTCEAEYGVIVTGEFPLLEEYSSQWTQLCFTIRNEHEKRILDGTDIEKLEKELPDLMQKYGVTKASSNDRPISHKGPDGIVTISDGLTELSRFMFFQRNDIKGVIIPNSVKKICRGAFRFCDSLKKIVIPDSVTEIEGEAFSDCSALESVTLSNSLKKIGVKAFLKCDSLKKIVIPDSVTEIESEAFSGCSALESVTLSNSLKKIGEKAFKDCESLKKVHLPDTLTEVGKYAFMNCKSLQEINLPESLTEMGWGMINECWNLRNLTIPHTMKKVTCMPNFNLTVTYKGTKREWNKLNELSHCAFIGKVNFEPEKSSGHKLFGRW